MTKRSRNSQPILSIPRSPLELVLEIIAFMGILWGCWIIFQSWDALPQRIPIHFGLSGQPDAWGDKVAIWILPAVAVFFEVLWAVLGNYPHTFNYPVAITEENVRMQYQLARSLLAWLKVEMIWLFVRLTNYYNRVGTLLQRVHESQPEADAGLLELFYRTDKELKI